MNVASIRLPVFGTLLTLMSGFAHAFDHSQAAWQALLARHVKLTPLGNASAVDYQGVQSDRAALKTYLKSLSSVSEAE